MAKKKTRRRITDEFKAETVKLRLQVIGTARVIIQEFLESEK